MAKLAQMMTPLLENTEKRELILARKTETMMIGVRDNGDDGRDQDNEAGKALARKTVQDILARSLGKKEVEMEIELRDSA
jgi:hypothetical protein